MYSMLINPQPDSYFFKIEQLICEAFEFVNQIFKRSSGVYREDIHTFVRNLIVNTVGIFDEEECSNDSVFEQYLYGAV